MLFVLEKRFRTFPPMVKVTCRTTSAERKRRSRIRQQKLAGGFERIELYLPPIVRAAWTARERISDAHTIGGRALCRRFSRYPRGMG